PEHILPSVSQYGLRSWPSIEQRFPFPAAITPIDGRPRPCLVRVPTIRESNYARRTSRLHRDARKRRFNCRTEAATPIGGSFRTLDLDGDEPIFEGCRHAGSSDFRES